MTWVIKLYPNDEPDEPTEYLHHWTTGLYDRWVDKPEWVTEQKYAYRFADRNYAARVAFSGAVQGYHDNPQIVRLRPATDSPSQDPTDG